MASSSGDVQWVEDGMTLENATRQMMSDGREPQESGIAGYTGCTSRNLSCSKKLLIIVMSL